jgi:hypothetical protein
MKCPYHPAPLPVLKARLSRVVLRAAAVSLVLLPWATPFASADTCPPSQWERFPTPSHENLHVLPGSDIDRFSVGGTNRSTLYAIGTWNSPCANDTPDDPLSSDQTLFDSGQAPRLWQSSDGGMTWTDKTDSVLKARNLPDAGDGPYDDFLAFTSVSAAPDDSGVVMVAGYDKNGTAVVVASSDGASEFSWLGCGPIDGIILCAAVSPETDGVRQLAVGTADSINGGRIWRYEAGTPWQGDWVDTGEWDGWADSPSWGNNPTSIDAITSLAFSPQYDIDRSIVAIAIANAEEPDGDPYTGFYLVAGTWDATESWNTSAGFDNYPLLVRHDGDVIHAPPAAPGFLLRTLTSLALPADFNGEQGGSRVALVAVNGSLVNPSSDSLLTEGGFLFWTRDDTLSGELLAAERNPWVASIAYSGTTDMQGRIVAGTSYPRQFTWNDVVDWFDAGSPALSCCSGVGVLYSADNDPCCPRWEWAERPPSGQFNAQVAWSHDGAAAYASTSGSGRLWHDGKWYADESAFSSTANPSANWEQTGLIDTMIHRIVDMAYEPSSNTLYVHTKHDFDDGSVCDCESLWRTGDDGSTWVRQLHGNPDVSDDDNDAFDSAMNGYYRGFYKPVTEGYLLAGGMRYLIGDAIDTDDEQQVEQGFDANAVYRLFEGDDGHWQTISELVLNYEGLLDMNCSGMPGDVLYVGFDDLWWDYTANVPLSYQPDGADPSCPPGHDCRKVSGVARCLDPGRIDCCGNCEWDYLIRGLTGTPDTDGVYEQLLLAGANCSEQAIRLWAIDDGNGYWSDGGGDGESYDWCAAEFSDDRWGRLWTYDDCYAATAIITNTDVPDRTIPSDPCRCAHEAFSLEWQQACDSCEYEIQIAYDREFSHIVLETESFVRGVVAHSVRFYRPPQPDSPGLLIDKGILKCNQAYWWRVRAHLASTDEVISSWWSIPERFFTAPGPPGQLELRAPGDGVSRVPVKDIGFSWTRVTGATRYDFLLVDRDRGHVASQVGDFTSFVLPLTLDYDTPYVWRVIALDGDRVVSESVRATFRTMPAPASLESDVQRPVINPPGVAVRYDWMWYFAGAIGLLLALALAALSHVNRRIKRGRRRDR